MGRLFKDGKLYVIEEDPLIDNFVDLGLPSGTLWCKYNLKHDGTLSSSAYFFKWGELSFTGAPYTQDNYRLYDGTKITKYNNEDGLVTLNKEDDAASMLLNKRCNIPTIEQWEELVEHCTITRLSGSIEITGQNGNSITLKDCPVVHTTDPSSRGTTYYWSSSLKEDNINNARCFMTQQYSANYSFSDFNRWWAMGIRPVITPNK